MKWSSTIPATTKKTARGVFAQLTFRRAIKLAAHPKALITTRYTRPNIGPPLRLCTCMCKYTYILFLNEEAMKNGLPKF